MLPIRNILCSTDFSEPSLAALRAACEFAEHFDADLHLIHVVPYSEAYPTDLVVIAAASLYPSDGERSDDARARLDRSIEENVPSGVRAHSVVKMGYAAHEITAAAEQMGADMIVIGTHGETGWRHLAFGSVAEKVVQLAKCPVLTVHNGPQPDESTAATAEKLTTA